MTRGTLQEGEPHPAAMDALGFVRSIPFEKQCLLQGALSSCAIEGNRMAEICSETFRRVVENKPVSDRYILGLAWYLKNIGGE